MTMIAIDILAIVLELIIYYFFFKHFFGKPHFSKGTMLAIYVAVGLYSFGVSYFPVPDILQRISYLSIIVILALCYRGHIFIKFFVPFLFQASSMMVEECYGVILTPLRLQTADYGEAGFYVYYFTGVVLSNITILLLVRLLAGSKEYLFVKKSDLDFPLYFIILFIFPVGMLFVIDQISFLIIKSGEINYITVLPVVLLTGLTIAFFFLFDGLLHNLQNKKQLELLHNQLEQEQKYHAALLDKHQQFQALRHDMKQNFSNIAGLIKNAHYEDALQYAQNQSGQLASVSAINTGQPLLDTILTNKDEQAKQIDAQLESYVSADWQHISLDINALASLCANALNNALEAVIQISQPQQRKIWCSITQEGEYLHIIVRNTTADDVKISDNMVATTKKDKALHGYGLKIIRNITAKYDGTYTLQYRDRLFTLRVLLPVGKDDDL